MLGDYEHFVACMNMQREMQMNRLTSEPSILRPIPPLPWPEFNRQAAEYFRRRVDLTKKKERD